MKSNEFKRVSVMLGMALIVLSSVAAGCSKKTGTTVPVKQNNQANVQDTNSNRQGPPPVGQYVAPAKNTQNVESLNREDAPNKLQKTNIDPEVPVEVKGPPLKE